MSKNFAEVALLKFNPKLPRLAASEKKVLDLLVSAGELIAPLYQEQEKQAREIDEKEVLQIAKTDRDLLSPYTVVKKVDGKLKAIPYHIYYADFLKPIANKLNQAANIAFSKDFKRALRTQAKALLDGSYENAVIAWLKAKPTILDISIGPLNHFDDRLFYGKASYHAWVGVTDSESTERYNNYKNITLNARRKALVAKERIDSFDNVKSKVLDVLVFSGFMARTKFVGINLPMELNVVEKYGSQATLFNQSNDLRLQEQILPTFNKIFSPEFRKNFTKEDLRRGYLRIVGLHELAHSYLNYKHASENLKELFSSIYELAATVLGLRMAGSLHLKDRIDNKQLESMMIAFICRTYYVKEESKRNKTMKNYGLGGSIFINCLLERGALKRFKEFMMPNFTKVFFSLHELSDQLESLLAEGTREDAEALIKKYQEE